MNPLFFRTAGAVLLAAACGNAAAQAGLTLYGILDVALVHADDQGGRAHTSMRSGNQYPSRLGFKGSDDLGGGLRALYVLEAGVNVDDGTAPQAGSFFNRQSFAGLADDHLGTVTIGRQYTPYYQFIAPIARNGNPTGATGAHPGDIDSLDVANRVGNAIGYTSPQWRGLQLGVLAGAGEQERSQADGNAFSAAVRYEVGAWNIAVGYEALKNGPQRSGWDPTVAASLLRSPLNAGYLSAASVRYLGAAAWHTAGKLGLGAIATSVRYAPDAASRFHDAARFDTAGIAMSWQTATPWLLNAGLAWTRERAANGIGHPAAYRQLSLEQSYALSRRTALYLVQARQLARGSTLGANGTPVPAVAVIGDSQAATPSSTGRQNVFMAGLRTMF